jgi:hypothetical protein
VLEDIGGAAAMHVSRDAARGTLKGRVPYCTFRQPQAPATKPGRFADPRRPRLSAVAVLAIGDAAEFSGVLGIAFWRRAGGAAAVSGRGSGRSFARWRRHARWGSRESVSPMSAGEPTGGHAVKQWRSSAAAGRRWRVTFRGPAAALRRRGGPDSDEPGAVVCRSPWHRPRGHPPSCWRCRTST